MSTVASPDLIVGLGNPGAEHQRDRHNAGFCFVDRLAAGSAAVFRDEARLLGSACQVTMAGHVLRVVKPATWMNRSGQCVRRVMDYYRIPADRVLVVHDDVDLPPGSARLKIGGGHGGNNGLRDIIAHCGREFLRLRLGVGHPGRKELVVGHVLRAPTAAEQRQIEEAMDAALHALEIWLGQDFQRAMTWLHTNTPATAASEPVDG